MAWAQEGGRLLQHPLVPENLREDLEEQGVLVEGFYALTMLANPVGGRSHGFANAGELEMGFLFDLEKIMGVCRTEFFWSFAWNTGKSLTDSDVGNLFDVSSLFGGTTVRLNEVYFQHHLCRKRLLVKAGRLNAANDFMSSPLYYYWVNLAFDENPVSIFFNTPFSANPLATWGAYAHVHLDPRIQVKFGIYNGNIRIWENRFHGLNWTFENPQGYMMLSEVEFTTCGGHYKGGAYYVTGDTPRWRGGTSGGNYGYYFLFDQVIYKRGPRELIPLGALTFAPSDKNFFPFFFWSGLILKAPFCSRPDDTAVFGFAYGKMSNSLRGQQRLGRFGGVPQNYEAIVEANYWISVTPWLQAVPDIQYVINPSGFGTIKNALVVGVQLFATL